MGVAWPDAPFQDTKGETTYKKAAAAAAMTAMPAPILVAAPVKAGAEVVAVGAEVPVGTTTTVVFPDG